MGSVEEAWHLGDTPQNLTRKGAAEAGPELWSQVDLGPCLPFATYFVILGKSLRLFGPRFLSHPFMPLIHVRIKRM